MVRPGRQPTCPRTLWAGMAYRARLFSSQSAQRVSRLRSWARMRCLVVTPPTRGSANGLTSSARVAGVHRVSLSTSTTTSPDASSTPVRMALRLPATGVQVQVQVRPPGHWLQMASRARLRGPLMTTMVSSGSWAAMRRSTSQNRSGGSSTTGTTTLVAGR